MPRDLTEYATYDTPVSVPTPGDAGTSASVNDAFQALADRTGYLKTRADKIDTGVPRIQNGVTSEMQNLNASNTDQFFDINRGLFNYWDDAGTVIADGVLILDSLVTPGAHWYRSDWNANTEGGSPVIGPTYTSVGTPTGRIPSNCVPFGLQHASWFGDSSVGSFYWSNSTTSPTFISTFTWDQVSFKAGDIIQVDLHFNAWISGANRATLTTAFTEGMTTGLGSVDCEVASDTPQSRFLILLNHVVVSDCDWVSIALEGKAGAASSVIASIDNSLSTWIRWRIIRP